MRESLETRLRRLEKEQEHSGVRCIVVFGDDWETARRKYIETYGEDPGDFSTAPEIVIGGNVSSDMWREWTVRGGNEKPVEFLQRLR